MERAILILILIPFAALTGVAIWEHGPTGIFESAADSSASLQIFVDLVIALLFFLVWMWRDAKENGRNPYIWTVITLTTGSFGPLFYLLLRPAPASDDAPAENA